MSSRTPTLSEVVSEYLSLQVAKQRSPETVRVDRAVLGRLVRDVGDIQIGNLKPDHIERWFYGPKGLMGEHETRQYGRKTNPGISPSTHNAYRSRVKVFFDWCSKRGYTRRDLLERVSPLKVPARTRQRPAPSTLLALLDAAENARDRAWIAVSLNTGLRSSEIKTITVGDVDLDGGYLSVTITKTGDVDDVPITSDLDRELRTWMTVYAESLDVPLRHDHYLFPARVGNLISHYEEDPDTGKKVMVRTPWRWEPTRMIGRSEDIVKRALGSLGLPTKYEGTHTIRRAVALAYFESVSQTQGDVAALRETAALLHHKNLHTTERYLGMTAEKNRRNQRMRGKSFLTAMVEDDNVVPLRPKALGE